jgi:hypothetical protein
VVLKNVVINPFDKFLQTPIEIEVNRYNTVNYNLDFNSCLYNRVAVPLRIQAGAYIDILEGVECFATGASCTEFMVSPKPWVVSGNSTYAIDNTYSCVMANQYNSNSILRWTTEETTNIETGISVSPNPTSDFITVASNLKGDLSLQIYSVGGKLIYSNKFVEVIDVDLGFLPVGTYIVKVYNDGQITTSKLIKQ